MKNRKTLKSRTIKTFKNPPERLRERIGLRTAEELEECGLRDLTRAFSLDAVVAEVSLRDGWTTEAATYFSRVAIEKAAISAYDAAELGLQPDYLAEWKTLADKAGKASRTLRSLAIEMTSYQFDDLCRKGEAAPALAKPFFQASTEVFDAANMSDRRDWALSSASNFIGAMFAIERFGAFARNRSRELATTIKNHGAPEKRAFLYVMMEAWAALTGKLPGSAEGSNPFIPFVQAAWEDAGGEPETSFAASLRTELKRAHGQLFENTRNFLPYWFDPHTS